MEIELIDGMLKVSCENLNAINVLFKAPRK